MRIKKLALTGVMTALAIVLNEFISIPIPPTSSPLIKLSIGILPIYAIALYAGFLYASVAAVSADILGFFLVGASKGYAFNLGFTLNALLSGLILGLILHFKNFFEGKKGFITILITTSVILLIVLPTFAYGFLKNNVGESHGGNALLITIIILSLVLNLSVIAFSYLSMKDGLMNATILSYIIYVTLVSLILTPFWILMYAKGINYFYLWVTRLITVPLQIIIYSLLSKAISLPLKKFMKDNEKKNI